MRKALSGRTVAVGGVCWDVDHFNEEAGDLGLGLGLMVVPVTLLDLFSSCGCDRGWAVMVLENIPSVDAGSGSVAEPLAVVSVVALFVVGREK